MVSPGNSLFSRPCTPAKYFSLLTGTSYMAITVMVNAVVASRIQLAIHELQYVSWAMIDVYSSSPV